jgi:hypothetical protein
MLPTYKATLKGNHLEWREEAPEGLPRDRELAVMVTILDESASPARPGRGSRMAAALEKLAKAGGVRDIDDPLRWERDLRREPPLPGRD